MLHDYGHIVLVLQASSRVVVDARRDLLNIVLHALLQLVNDLSQLVGVLPAELLRVLNKLGILLCLHFHVGFDLLLLCNKLLLLAHADLGSLRLVTPRDELHEAVSFLGLRFGLRSFRATDLQRFAEDPLHLVDEILALTREERALLVLRAEHLREARVETLCGLN